MKKLVILLLVALAVTSCGGGNQSGVKKFRLAESHPDGYPTVVGDLAFAKLVKEKSGGTIQIDVYNNSVLGDEKNAIEQTQTGAVQFVRVGVNPLTSLNPIMGAFAMPYLFRDSDHMFKVLDSAIGDEILQSIQEQKLLGLNWFDAGFRNIYNAKHEVHSPADMKGLKIRVQETPLMMDMMRMLGASPTPMTYSEVYPGIQNGVIDGAENNWPSYMTAAHVEVAKYFTENQHQAAPEMILVNTDVWASFSDEEKQWIKEAALESAVIQRAEWVRQETDYKAQAIAKGTIITDLTPEEHQQFVDALMPMYDQPAYTQYADLVKRIREIQ